VDLIKIAVLMDFSFLLLTRLNQLFLLLLLLLLLLLYKPFLGFGCFLSFLTPMLTVGLHGRGIRPSQCHYLHTGQHKHRMNVHNTDIHSPSGIQTHNPSVRASEDSTCAATVTSRLNQCLTKNETYLIKYYEIRRG
jgi:hypothetical protein